MGKYNSERNTKRPSSLEYSLFYVQESASRSLVIIDIIYKRTALICALTGDGELNIKTLKRFRNMC
jgi:hypothetical protein